MYLLDTNICIYLMKGTFPALAEKILTVHPSELAISAVTVFELEYGAAKSRWGERTRQNLRIFLSAFTICPSRRTMPSSRAGSARRWSRPGRASARMTYRSPRKA